MGCSGCTIDGNGTPKGCGSKGHCSTGQCNKMNTYDWLSPMMLNDPNEFQFVEVSFKNGARKDFFMHAEKTGAITGDMVVVESSAGYDIGKISLSGELVRLQMRKKRMSEDRVMHKIIRIANERDLERLDEARSREKGVLVKARAISRMLDIEMKLGDVEFQGDNKKATFYYTAEGRIDFRELVRHYASEFRVKVEMRQIGARQESARIGGLGPCGRELCCSTWLSDFKSVSTSAARYQNISINQTKLSGQCGRLKCCLNYELDSYLDAIQSFPKKADRINTKYNSYDLIKTDIFKGIMYYIQVIDTGRGPILSIPKDRVAEVVEMNRQGIFPEELGAVDYATIGIEKEEVIDFEDVTGQIELPPETKSNKRRRENKNRNSRPDNRRNDERNRRQDRPTSGPSARDRDHREKPQGESDSRPVNKESTSLRPPRDNRPARNIRDARPPRPREERKPNIEASGSQQPREERDSHNDSEPNRKNKFRRNKNRNGDNRNNNS